MFTGLVTGQGTVRRARERGGVLELAIEAGVAKELKKGDSVALNGVCLTATGASRRRFSAQATGETLARTALRSLGRGSAVNLELPLKLGDRLGGHLVQGHVDGVARVIGLEEDDGVRRMWLAASPQVLRYLVPKGSVTLDGVSLTVTGVGESSFDVALIPYTLEVTTLGGVKVGSELNVEVDLVAKYIERLAGGNGAPPGK